MNAALLIRRSGFGLLLAAAAALAVDALWIHAKAALSQVLLRQAWAEAQSDGGTHRPWPWADTHPVALLRMRELDVEQVVLAGDDGRTLAFGPGWAPASATPAAGGTVVFSGHRDTHFAWLRQLVQGDQVEVESLGGLRRYKVAETRIADSRTERVAIDPERSELLLITCWPFDAVQAGGPMRYVVRLVEA
jgi:sortase A